MKLNKLGTIAAIALVIVLAVLFLTAPKTPQAIFRVTDSSGKPIANAVITPRGLRTKPGPFQSGWYGWSEEAQHLEPRPVTTDQHGTATIPYPFYVFEKLETGTLCLAVNHPDYVAQDPERVVSTMLPHGAPWRTLLLDLFNRIRHHSLVARPDPIILQKGATLRITVTNAPSGSGKFIEQISEVYSDHDSWTEPTRGILESQQIAEGSHTVRVAFLQTNGPAWFSDVVAIKAVKNKTNILSLSLTPGTTIHGQLDRTNPRPVKNGRVIANIWPPGIKPSESPPQWHAWSKINEDGTFTISSMPTGDLEIAALCDGYISTNGPGTTNMRYPQKHQLGPEDLTITIGMEPTATLEVTLHDDKGHAVTNADVVTWPNLRWGEWAAVIFGNDCYNTTGTLLGSESLKTWINSRPKDFRATSDANGIAILSNLPPTTDALDLQHDRFALPVTTNGWAGGKTRSISLKLTTKETNHLSLRVVPKEQSVISHY